MKKKYQKNRCKENISQEERSRLTFNARERKYNFDLVLRKQICMLDEKKDVDNAIFWKSKLEINKIFETRRDK